MIRSVKAGVAAAAIAGGVLVFVPGPAEAAYANCTALQRDYRYGVAVSERAARRQVNTGHYRPAVRPRVYRANVNSDRDRDGTACEVTR